MNSHQPIEFENRQVNTRLSAASVRRKFFIASLVVLIVSTMLIWFSFLGWGVLSMLRSLGALIGRLWTTLL
jgi:hypothetical protein